MAVPPPENGTLWQLVVQRAGGVEAVWPMDDEDAADRLAEAWTRVGDGVGNAGEQLRQSSAAIGGAWKDSPGQDAAGQSGVLAQQTRDVALKIGKLGIMAGWYGGIVRKAKEDVRKAIAKWEPQLAKAATSGGHPGSGVTSGDMQEQVVSAASQECMSIIDLAADAVKNTKAKQENDARVRRLKARAGLVPLGVETLTGLSEKIPGPIKLLGKAPGIFTLPAMIALDVNEGGKPVDEAILSNVGGWVASTAVGEAAGRIPIVGPVLGPPAGFVAGAFASGALESLYEHGPTHVATALEKGWDNVWDEWEALKQAPLPESRFGEGR
ncbi:WXG100-like domain-containing protein [Amycolatopsis silviterrae]|uniref:Outer membrane channel protein CpnT-like N-terminal domain-containing protein n=1 Tax=Amycolatopsis silviterrae TaxID=1656914 RepID=A0ABW5HKL4_9PSEU